MDSFKEKPACILKLIAFTTATGVLFWMKLTESALFLFRLPAIKSGILVKV
jgi:hypothetical protein